MSSFSGIVEIPNVTTLSILENLHTSAFSAGQRVILYPQRSVWIYDPESILNTNNTTIIEADGGGNWIRDIVQGSLGWNLEANIYINSVTGDDTADGLTSDTALKSLDEYFYRLGKQVINGAEIPQVFVNLSGDFSTKDYAFDINISNEGSLFFLGERTAITNITLSAVTVWAGASQVVGSYTLTGAPNLTSLGYIGKFARITSGPRAGYWAPIAKDLGSGVFRTVFTDINTFTTVEPHVGDSLQIYSIPKVGGTITVRNSGHGYVYFAYLDLGVVGANHSVFVFDGGIEFLGCVLRGCDVYEGVWDCTQVGCYTIEHRSYASSNIIGCVFDSIGGTALSARGGGNINIQTNTIVQNYSINIGHGVEGPGTITVSGPLAILEYNTYTSEGFFVGYNSLASIANNVWMNNAGAASLYGYLVFAGSKIVYVAGFLPLITGTAPTNPYYVGGTSKIQATIPFFNTNNGAAIVLNQ